MILGLLAGAGRRVVETVYGWRQFEFGPPTGDYRCRVAVTTNVEWQQLGAGVTWCSDEGSVMVEGCVGPLGWLVTVARPEPVQQEPESCSTPLAWPVGERVVHLHRAPGHVGAVVAWTRIGVAGDLVVKAKVGPVGVLVEPADVAGI